MIKSQVDEQIEKSKEEIVRRVTEKVFQQVNQVFEIK